ncbi:MAG: Lrp/AsnC family transcriptional regulator [Robiginitomaculum sp.]|nr:Lrp/AsnC family transcriptional regulator [Robiginitomaculum sp.]
MKRAQKQNFIFDEIDAKLIAALGQDARVSMRDLAKLVGMSAPSVAERIRRLTDSGVISAFTVELDLKKTGYNLQAIVRAKPLPGQLHLVERILQEMPECIECDKVTGEDCFIVRICLRSIDVLDEVLSPLKDRAETNTSIIHATPVRRRSPPILL